MYTHSLGGQLPKGLVMRVRKAVNAGLAAVLAASVGLAGIPAYATESQWREGGGLVYPYGKELSAVADNGVATYVGGNFSIAPTGDSSNMSVESEGLTVVKGDVSTNVSKWTGETWGYSSFRWGNTGIGSGFRPKLGSTALAVGGNFESEIRSAWGWDAYGSGINFIGHTIEDSITYRAQIGGTNGKSYSNKLMGSIDNSNPSYSNFIDTENLVYPNLGIQSISDVNGEDYSSFDVIPLSKTLAGISETGSVTLSSAPAQKGFIKAKYIPWGNVQYWFNFNGSGEYSENLLTFKGDGKSQTQVFNVSSDQMTSNGVNGLSYAFENIPENAAVVVNVDGERISFENGWRFWWNGVLIDNPYAESPWYAQEGSTYESSYEPSKKAHDEAAKSIMWNFKNAKSVNINGGRLNEGDNRDHNGKRWGDPAAEFIGSILVPNGDLRTETSTSGRLLVSGDYNMTNSPDSSQLFRKSDGSVGSEYRNDYYSNSVIDMDQERHNYPWIGEAYYLSSNLEWGKVDQNNTPLSGSTWGVYNTLKNAQNQSNPLIVVKDNDSNDINKKNGSIQVGNLKQGYDYFIRELNTPSGYSMTNDVYYINAATVGTEVNRGLKPVNESSSDTVNGNAVVNQRVTDVRWAKYDGNTPPGKDALAGSEWTINNTPVKDSAVPVTSVAIYHDGKEFAKDSLDLFSGESYQLEVKAYPEESVQSFSYESSNPEVVSFHNGRIVAKSLSLDPVTLTVSSKVSPDVKKTLTIRVFTNPVPTMDGKALTKDNPVAIREGSANGISLVQDGITMSRPVQGTSSGDGIVKVEESSLVGISKGTVMMTLSYGTLKSTVQVTVVPKDHVAVFTKEDIVPYIGCGGGCPNTMGIITGLKDANLYSGNVNNTIYNSEEEANAAYELMKDYVHVQGEKVSDGWYVAYIPTAPYPDGFGYVIGTSVRVMEIYEDGNLTGKYEIGSGWVNLAADNYGNFIVNKDDLVSTVYTYYDNRNVPPTGLVDDNSGNTEIYKDGANLEDNSIFYMEPGASETYTAKLIQGTGDIKWLSSDENVATVQDGVVTAKSSGLARIYAYSYGNKNASFVVGVHRPGYFLTDYVARDWDKEVWGTEEWPIVNPYSTGSIASIRFMYNNSCYKSYWSSDANCKTTVIPEDEWESALSKYNSTIPGIVELRDGLYEIANEQADKKYYYAKESDPKECSSIANSSSYPKAYAACIAAFPDGKVPSISYWPTTLPSDSNGGGVWSSGRYLPEWFKLSTFSPLPVSPPVQVDFVDDADLKEQVNPEFTDLDPRPGYFLLDKLQDGDYSLKETKSPKGYDILKKEVSFTIKNGQVFWQEGVPVVDSVAWLANYKPAIPETPDTPQQGTPGIPNIPSTPQASEGTPKKAVALSKTGTSVAGMVALAVICLLCGYGALQYRRYYGKR